MTATEELRPDIVRRLAGADAVEEIDFAKSACPVIEIRSISRNADPVGLALVFSALFGESSERKDQRDKSKNHFDRRESVGRVAWEHRVDQQYAKDGNEGQSDDQSSRHHDAFKKMVLSDVSSFVRNDSFEFFGAELSHQRLGDEDCGLK